MERIETIRERTRIRNQRPIGYMVHWEWKKGAILESTYDDAIYRTEEAAIGRMRQLANDLKGKAVNFYVIHSDTFEPVKNYKEHYISNRVEEFIQAEEMWL